MGFGAPMKALVAGWFSFPNSDFTAGDLLACDLVCEWLQTAGFSCDVALTAPLRGGVDLQRVDPDDYTHAVFVCGPFMQNALEAQFLGRFANCFVVGVNLSLPVPLDVWHPFDLLVERDSSVGAHPDITFVSPHRLVPVVGVCLVEPYDVAMVAKANAAVDRLIASREMAVVRIDTRVDVNTTGLRNSAEIESLLARMDVVITTRLHGTVLALKNGVPALAIDPEAGGGKIARQAETIGWPVVVTADRLDDHALQVAFDYCLSEEARSLARECCRRSIAALEDVRREFIMSIRGTVAPGPKHDARTAFAVARGWNSI
jgi:hypothetical protein